MNHFERTYTPVRSRFESQGIHGIMLDIDDSLADTNIHWARLIMRKYGHPHSNNPDELIRTHRYVRCVPEWQEPEIEEEVERYMRSDDVTRSLPVVNGSQESISEISKRKSIACYVTGRPSGVKKASYDWIRNREFPYREIFFQPDTEELTEMGFGSGSEWRANLLKFLYPYVEGIIDDNEVLLEHINGYHETFYLLGGDIKLQRPNVISCPDWQSVTQEIIHE